MPDQDRDEVPDELSIDELEEAAGGIEGTNTNCVAGCGNTNCVAGCAKTV